MQNSSYVVLGASGGIGSSLCKKLRTAGANVMAAGRNEARLLELSKELDCEYSVVDASNFAEVENCFQFAVQKFGRVDGSVNCVGSLLLKPAHLTSEDDFNAVLAANLVSAFACVRSSAKFMRKDGGSIVLLSTAAASIGLSNHEAISAAKAGVEGLMLAAATTYSRQHVRVNCVAPGLVLTELTKTVTSNETSRQSSLSMHPLGRLGEPDDIANAIAWLLSGESSWVTGQVIAVDGGLSKLKTASTQSLAAR